MSTATKKKPKPKPEKPPEAAPEPPPIPDLSIVQAAEVFKTLSDVTRCKILETIGRVGAANVTQVCDMIDMSQPAVSHHFALLRHGRYVTARRDGKNVVYSITPAGLKAYRALVAMV